MVILVVTCKFIMKSKTQRYLASGKVSTGLRVGPE